MPDLAFVIPVLNEEEAVVQLLTSLRQQYPGSELIVVDGGSGDNTVARAMPLCDQLLVTEPGRAGQMNLGASVSRATCLCFLHADSLPAVAEQDLLRRLAGTLGWGFCRVRLSGSRPIFRVIEWFMNQRSRLTGIGTGDQMLFLHRALFERTGGFDVIPLMEDVAYCNRLRRLGRPVFIDEPVQTSSRRWEQRGVLRTVLQMWFLRLAYFVGASPQRLWRYYYGQ